MHFHSVPRTMLTNFLHRKLRTRKPRPGLARSSAEPPASVCAADTDIPTILQPSACCLPAIRPSPLPPTFFPSTPLIYTATVTLRLAGQSWRLLYADEARKPCVDYCDARTPPANAATVCAESEPRWPIDQRIHRNDSERLDRVHCREVGRVQRVFADTWYVVRPSPALRALRCRA